MSDPNLIVGFDTSDDAAVYRISDTQALIQTVDIFPPIVDDPFDYGRIAAANALSDVFAMGGQPKLAMNVLCIPEDLDQEITLDILRGGQDRCMEAGAVICGGHTIKDNEKDTEKLQCTSRRCADPHQSPRDRYPYHGHESGSLKRFFGQNSGGIHGVPEQDCI